MDADEPAALAEFVAAWRRLRDDLQARSAALDRRVWRGLGRRERVVRELEEATLDARRAALEEWGRHLDGRRRGQG